MHRYTYLNTHMQVYTCTVYVHVYTYTLKYAVCSDTYINIY